ncbi:hypothetical protein BT96DRAFT_555076 [Gymnopus androsaceus JB14]|uniref:Uncharacterized protein n=1 Tax=Gymnopus androsaceus JB14 TaxID=1447944 RepID=A0A6A4GK40_9AGAR|nr:hypothetical protein BT96DRAFT_555076 [Gymnopus androsaceus JB14]
MWKTNTERTTLTAMSLSAMIQVPVPPLIPSCVLPALRLPPITPRRPRPHPAPLLLLLLLPLKITCSTISLESLESKLNWLKLSCSPCRFRIKISLVETEKRNAVQLKLTAS